MTKTSTKKLVGERRIPGNRSGVDTVRASRDAHQFHEAWLARRALGLLRARDDLCGIAIEGQKVLESNFPFRAVNGRDLHGYRIAGGQAE